MREREVCDFVRVYVFDWHVLSALAVPLIFSALFPVYWILICPEIWHRHPGMRLATVLVDPKIYKADEKHLVRLQKCFFQCSDSCPVNGRNRNIS